MSYTQVRLKIEYRDKLRKIAELRHRSMANVIEVLIQAEYDLKFDDGDTNE